MEVTRTVISIGGYDLQIGAVHDGFFVSSGGENNVTEIKIPHIGTLALPNGKEKEIKPKKIGLYISGWEPTIYYMLRVESSYFDAGPFKYLPHKNEVSLVKDSSSGYVSEKINLGKTRFKTLGANPNLSVIGRWQIKGLALFIKDDLIPKENQIAY